MSSALAVASSSSAGAGLDVALHPLVIINISDHYTRMRVQMGASARVFGALLGTQSGRRVDIENSFELVVAKDKESAEGEMRIDTEYLQLKLGQYKRGYESIDIVGWYSTGTLSSLGELDLQLQQQMEQHTESPLYLLLDPAPLPTARELPLTMLESQLQAKPEGGVATMRFAQVPYHVDSSDAERIAVEHVSRHSAGSHSQLATQLQNVRGSVATLAARLAVLAKYLRAVERKELAVDAAALRAASALVQLLPAIEGAQFTQNFLLEYSDALLVAYLSAITKTSASLATLLEKFHVAYERQGGQESVHTPVSMRASGAGGSSSSRVLPSKPEGYVLGQKIGNRVWSAETEESGVACVVKTIAFDVTKNPAKTAKVEQALEHFKALTHAHMVKSVHSFYVAQELWVIEDTRGWEGDTLRALHPHEHSRPLPEPVLAALARPVLLALQYVHASGRAWSDVRGKNIFVQRTGHVLINLVTLRSVVQEKTRDSLPFVSPELLAAQALDFNTSGKGDVWSLGIALLELANNATPFTSAESTPPQITQRILTETPPTLRDDLPWQWSQDFVDFLAHCLQRDPSARATADELLRHPFIQSAPSEDYLVHNLLALFDQDSDPQAVNAALSPPLSTNNGNNPPPPNGGAPPPGVSAVSASPLRLATPPLDSATTSAHQSQADPSANPVPVQHSVPTRRTSDPSGERAPPSAFVPPPMTRGGSDTLGVLVAPRPTTLQPSWLSAQVVAQPSPNKGVSPPLPLGSVPSVPIPSTSAQTASAPMPNTQSSSNTSAPQRSASTPRGGAGGAVSSVVIGSDNVPVETTLAESAQEFLVFVRTLPSTKVMLRLESRTLVIAGEFPALLWGPEHGLPEDAQLLDTLQNRFERRLVFPTDIDPNSVRKQLDKESSLMTIRIRKFSHRDLGYEQF